MGGLCALLVIDLSFGVFGFCAQRDEPVVLRHESVIPFPQEAHGVTAYAPIGTDAPKEAATDLGVMPQHAQVAGELTSAGLPPVAAKTLTESTNSSSEAIPSASMMAPKQSADVGRTVPLSQFTPSFESKVGSTVSRFDGVAPVTTPSIATYGQLGSTQMQNIGVGANAVGIHVKTSRGNVEKALKFYVFSAPGCKDCATVDSHLPEVSTLFAPVLMPAGFTENPEAMRGIASAYCAQNADIQWMAMANGLPIPAGLASCDWIDRAKASELISIISGVQGDRQIWPVIVAPNGAYHVGPIVGPNPAYALSEWLFVNSKYVAATP